MIQLSKGLKAWQTSAFNEVVKDEIEHLDANTLLLQQGLTHGSYALGENITAMITDTSETANFIQVKAGIFYTSIIAGCSCADDPTPVDEYAEYCEIQLDIDKKTASTSISLL